MSVEITQITMSIEQYLEAEATGIVKHEYVHGCVFAMVGATDAHNKIALSMASILHLRLKGTQCSAYMSDMKVMIDKTNVFYYPDVMVTCEPFSAAAVFKTQPVLIVEVLSPSAADIDRREKLVNYGLIPSLQEYLIVHQKKRLVELYRKDEQGWKSTHTFEGQDIVVLQSLPGDGLEMPLDEIYAGVIDS